VSGEKYALSVRDGHQQVFFKCTRCSLEFFLMTWRTPHEVIEFFKPRATDSTSAAKHAGGVKASLSGVWQLRASDRVDVWPAALPVVNLRVCD
jgi:hypothetical protein